MYLLKKVFQLRDQANPEHEKPFLEHLEDLRVVVTRVVVTLVLAMLVCFAFNQQLMQVLRRPVDRLAAERIEAQVEAAGKGLPRPLTAAIWERAKEVERASGGLPPERREAFYRALGDPDLAFHARAAGELRAALALPDEARPGFLGGLADEPALAEQVRALLKDPPSPDTDIRGNLRMMSALKPTETFMLSMKLSFFAGIVISFPLLLMFILQFVTPGLHRHEKRLLWPALAIGFGLFLGGVFFAYFVVLPRALDFFYEWGNSLGVSNDWRIGEYISFATQFTLLFGLSFELPVVVMVLVKLGLLSHEVMSRTRSYAIVAIFIAAAIMTPTPDIMTLCLMALPMILLYELCIWLAWFDRRRELRREEAEARERMERLLQDRDADLEEQEAAYRSASEEVEESGDDGWSEPEAGEPEDRETTGEPEDPEKQDGPPEEGERGRFGD